MLSDYNKELEVTNNQ